MSPRRLEVVSHSARPALTCSCTHRIQVPCCATSLCAGEQRARAIRQRRHTICVFACVYLCVRAVWSHLHSLSWCYQTLNTCSTVQGQQLHKTACEVQTSRVGSENALCVGHCVQIYIKKGRAGGRGGVATGAEGVCVIPPPFSQHLQSLGCSSCHTAHRSQVSYTPQRDLKVLGGGQSGSRQSREGKNRVTQSQYTAVKVQLCVSHYHKWLTERPKTLDYYSPAWLEQLHHGLCFFYKRCSPVFNVSLFLFVLYIKCMYTVCIIDSYYSYVLLCYTNIYKYTVQVYATYLFRTS